MWSGWGLYSRAATSTPPLSLNSSGVENGSSAALRSSTLAAAYLLQRPPSSPPDLPAAFDRHRASVAELHRCPRPHLAREQLRVPVRKPHAAGGAGIADRRGIARAVDPVMRLRQLDPHVPDEIVRPRGQVGVGLRVVDPCKKPRLVVEPRVEVD